MSTCASRAGIVALLAAVGPAPALGASGLEPPLAAGRLVDVVLALGAVVAVIACAAWLARRALQPRAAAGNGLRIVTALSLGARERIVLVQVGRQQLLLGVGPGRVQTLHVLGEPIVEGARAPGRQHGAPAAGSAAATDGSVDAG